MTVSSNQREVWPNRQEALYIPNPHVPALNRKLEKSSDLVFVGRLNRGKRPELAAQAARATGSTIAFFGEGPLMAELRRNYESQECTFNGFVIDPWSGISDESILLVTSEYEGDGMNVVEAVLNGNPVLLADNKDLRRFDFPEQFYFRNFDDLVEKINASKNLNLNRFTVNDEIKKRLLRERDLNSVTSKWISLLRESSLN